jgi:integrase
MPKLIEGFAERLKVPPGKRDVLCFDGGHEDAVRGFGIRKFASGEAYYFVKYNIGRKQRRQSLGSVTRGNLKAMRVLASEVKARARLGQDIIAEKEAARSKPAATTLGEVVPKYLSARECELRERTYTEAKRYMERSWKSLHDRPIEAITRADIVGVIDELECDSGKVAADRARTALSALFAWAIDRGYCDVNPTMNIRARNQNGSRTRVLTEAELVEVWKACLEDDHGCIVRLLILTGQRRREIGDLEWPELNLAERQIDLPDTRTKNRRPHIVPLSDEALAIIKVFPRRQGRDLVFGSGAGGFSGWSKAKAELDARIAMARVQTSYRGTQIKSMPAWTLHDLRRSFVTHLNERKLAPPHVVEAILNHVSGHLAGVAGVYNKALYFAERRQALEHWSQHVLALVEGRELTVVPIKVAR